MKYILLIIIIIILFFYLINYFIKGVNIIKIIENFDENIIFNSKKNSINSDIYIDNIDNIYKNKIDEKDNTINYKMYYSLY